MDREFVMSFDSRSYLTTDDVRRIIQAAVFAADEILVPTTVEVDPALPLPEHDFVLRRLAELRELNVIRFWGVEGEHPRMRLAGGVRVAPDRVIVREDYERMVRMIDDRLMDVRAVLLRDRASSYDGITEVVLGKQTMWRFAVAQALNANRLLLERHGQASVTRFFSDLARYEEFEAKVIDQISTRLDLPDVSRLDIDAIATCRQFMPAFRAKLLETMQHKYDDMFLAKMIERIADAIVNEFFDTLQTLGPNATMLAGKRVILPSVVQRDIKWDLLRLILSPVIAARYAKYYFKWLDAQSAAEPMLLLMQLRSFRRRGTAGDSDIRG
ncbi:hypothetical protein ACWDA3_56105 [Nonomuraea rubra]